MTQVALRREPENIADHPVPANDPADSGDDRHDPETAREIESRHDAHSPVADPILPGRPRASLTAWVWLASLAALAAVLVIAALASRFSG